MVKWNWVLNIFEVCWDSHPCVELLPFLTSCWLLPQGGSWQSCGDRFVCSTVSMWCFSAYSSRCICQGFCCVNVVFNCRVNCTTVRWVRLDAVSALWFSVSSMRSNVTCVYVCPKIQSAPLRTIPTAMVELTLSLHTQLYAAMFFTLVNMFYS